MREMWNKFEIPIGIVIRNNLYLFHVSSLYHTIDIYDRISVQFLCIHMYVFYEIMLFSLFYIETKYTYGIGSGNK